MMKRVFLYSFIVLFISGCSLQTLVGANNTYQFDIKDDPQHYSSAGCKKYVLQVKNIDSYNPILSRSIYYSIGDYELATYSKSNWQEIPSKTIKSSLIQALRDTKIFNDVVSNRSSVQPDYVLEYSVEDFMQYFSEDMKSSDVDVKIHFKFIDYRSSKLLYSTTIEKKLPSASLDAIGGVKSISSALDDVVKQSSLWLDERCKEDTK
ncbi:membrane integrity-associated transporter subunit PqiC [bacterium]|nr:membrane integrity-associated transporter subunit PqiC [bacterium]